MGCCCWSRGLALRVYRGDPPIGEERWKAVPGGLRNAVELVQLIRWVRRWGGGWVHGWVRPKNSAGRARSLPPMPARLSACEAMHVRAS